jgi:4-hydroxy-2-oxoheptanedioate aldolase
MGQFIQNKLITTMAEGKPVYGTFIVTGEPALAEILGYSGFDFGIIDTEHSPNDTMSVPHLIRASQVSGLTPIVRVTKNDESLILRALDAGAAGVLVPQVNTAAQALAAVRAAKYAPAGERGVAGVVRAARYGFIPMKDYIQEVNTETLVITQVEHIDAVDKLEEILAVDGLDGIFIGPTDLSQSMGLTGQFQHPVLKQTMETIIRKAAASGKWAGIFCLNAEDAQYWLQIGARLLAVATDTMLFALAARNVIGSLRRS